MPPEPRRCACGCGYWFTTSNPAKRYAHPTHRPPKMSGHASGRGYAYRKLRAVIMAQPPNGHPCPRCRLPMTNDQWARKLLQCGHVVDLALTDRHRPLTLSDLRVEHSRCNASAGASMGNRLRSGTLRTTRTSRAW